MDVIRNEILKFFFKYHIKINKNSKLKIKK
jgi:hypothetical protein